MNHSSKPPHLVKVLVTQSCPVFVAPWTVAQFALSLGMLQAGTLE